MPQHMLIRLGQDGDLELQFQIRNNPVAQLWVERMQACRHVAVIPWITQIDFMDLAPLHKSRPVQLN